MDFRSCVYRVMEMDTNAEKEIPAKPVLTFSDALHHYFAMENELYEAKVRGDNSEMTGALIGVVDALRISLIETADTQGFGTELRSAINNELTAEKWTLWLRTTANKLRAAKPSLLSLELLGSASVVIAVAYYVVRVGAALALLAGFTLIALRLTLPWAMDKLAVNEERKLRRLRKIDIQMQN